MIKDIVQGVMGWGEQLNANFREIKERLEGSESGIEGVGNVLNQHTANKNNPHNVSKSDVGLGNVGNFGISDSTTANNSNSYASSKAVKSVNDLANAKLGKTEKAVDSDKLGGVNSSIYARKDIRPIFTKGVDAGEGVGAGLYIEKGKHVITNNDGGGNFNIRVGNNYATGITEEGFAGHISFDQNNGALSLKSTNNYQKIGETPTWNIGLNILPTTISYGNRFIIGNPLNYTNFTCVNGFSSWDTNLRLKFVKCNSGFVHFNGWFKRESSSIASGDLIGVLPVGFRPKIDILSNVVHTHHQLAGSVVIQANGNVIWSGQTKNNYVIGAALCIDTIFPTI